MARLVIVHGARDLRRTMRQAGVDMRSARDVNKRVGGLVADAARPAAPVGLTGKLARSVRAGATQKAAIVRAGRKTVPYAGPIHWGWPARNITEQPWLTETAQATEPAWLAIYQQWVRGIINKIRGT